MTGPFRYFPLALNIVYLAAGLAAFYALMRSARVHGSLLVTGE